MKRGHSLLDACSYTDDPGMCRCLEMAPRDLHNLCKSIILLLRSLPRSLKFHIVQSILAMAVKQILFYVGKYKLTVVVNHVNN